jgi:small subunit ribosomal protein S20
MRALTMRSPVANSASARKRIRSNERKHVRNRAVRSAVRTSITKARRALFGTLPAVETQEQVLAAVRALDRAAEKGILHRNNAARRKSRLMAMAHKLATAAAGGDEAAARTTAIGGEKGRSRARGKAGSKPAASRTTTARAAAAKTPARSGTRPTGSRTTKS